MPAMPADPVARERAREAAQIRIGAKRRMMALAAAFVGEPYAPFVPAVDPRWDHWGVWR